MRSCGRVGQAFWNRPKPKLLLQKNGCMIKWIERKAATWIGGKYIFRNYISFTQPYNSWICRKKKDFEFRKFLLLRIHENLVCEWGKKVSVFEMLSFCFAKSDLRVLNDILRKTRSKSKCYRGKKLETRLCLKRRYCEVN